MTVYSGNQRMQQAQRAAAKKLAACPPDARARFEQFYAEALAQEAGTVQQLDGSFNPYAVEQTLIDRCRAGSLGEAVGTEPGSGVGWIPVPRGLAPIPDAAQRLAAYRAAPARARRASAVRSANGNAPADVDDDAPSRRTRLLGIGLIGVALLLALFVVLRGSRAPASPPAQAAASSAAAARSGTPAPASPGVPALQGDPDVVGASPVPLSDVQVRGAELSYPASLEIQSSTQRDPMVLRVVPSRSERGGTWDAQMEPGTAAWLPGATINPSLCLPAEAASTLEALPRGSAIRLRLVSGTVHRYTVLSIERVGRWQIEVLSQQRAGLTLLACGMPGDERVVVQALYQPDDGGELTQTQESTMEIAPFVRLQVRAVSRETLADDTAVVRFDIHLTNIGTTALAAREFVDQARLGDQPLQALERSDRGLVLDAGHTRMVTFRYVLPPDAHTTDLVWRVVAPTGEYAEVTMPLPANRAVFPAAASTATPDATITSTNEARKEE